MNSMKLYRLLQKHVGDLNQLVVGLYNGDIEADAAESQAKVIIEQTIAAMNNET